MKTAAIMLGVLLIGAAMLFVSDGVLEIRGTPPREAMEVSMLSAAIEDYKSEHGYYPTDPATTEQLNPNTNYDPAAYIPASAFLYQALTSDHKKSLDPPCLLKTSKTGVTYIVDHWGNSLGYSTFKHAHPESPDGHNAPFDLWSTGGNKQQTDTTKWIKNW